MIVQKYASYVQQSKLCQFYSTFHYQSISLNCDESMKSDWFNHFYNLNLPTRSFKFSAISAKLLELFLISSIELAACSIVAEVS